MFSHGEKDIKIILWHWSLLLLVLQKYTSYGSCLQITGDVYLRIFRMGVWSSQAWWDVAGGPECHNTAQALPQAPGLSPAAQTVSVSAVLCQVGAPRRECGLSCTDAAGRVQPPGGRRVNVSSLPHRWRRAQGLKEHPACVWSSHNSRGQYSWGSWRAKLIFKECQSLSWGLYLPNISSLRLCENLPW